MFRKKFRPGLKSTVIYFLMLVSMIVAAGCGSATQQPAPQGSAPLHVTLSPGDIIEIKFSYAEQFNEVQTIRPDGKISLPLVGELQAAGKTPTELRKELVQLHSGHLQHPEMAVIVRSQYERKVFVGGAVMTPGLIEMPGNLTVLEAIMQAGGFDLITAHVDSVILIRHNKGNKPVAHKLQFEDALEGKEYTPVYLEPQDVVYVPRTTIVEVDQWVQQHIYDLLPVRGIGIGYSLD